MYGHINDSSIIKNDSAYGLGEKVIEHFPFKNSLKGMIKGTSPVNNYVCTLNDGVLIEPANGSLYYKKPIINKSKGSISVMILPYSDWSSIIDFHGIIDMPTTWGSGNEDAFKLWIHSDGTLDFEAYNSLNSIIFQIRYSGKTISEWIQYQWYHIVINWEDGKQELYLDNMLVGSDFQPISYPLWSQNYLYLGTSCSPINDFLNGKIKNLTIFNEPIDKYTVNKLFEAEGNLAVNSGVDY